MTQMNTDYHDDLLMNVFVRRPPGRRSNPPSRRGGDCFAPLAKTLRDCLCVRLLSFFSGLINEYGMLRLDRRYHCGSDYWAISFPGRLVLAKLRN